MKAFYKVSLLNIFLMNLPLVVNKKLKIFPIWLTFKEFIPFFLESKNSLELGKFCLNVRQNYFRTST